MKHTNTVALGGICTALVTVFLYLSSIVPGVELTMYALSSLFIAVMIEEKGVAAGLTVYAAAGILGFFLMANKLGIIPYAVFFGIYPAIKFYAERLKSKPAQFGVKIASFCVMLAVTYAMFMELFFGSLKEHGFPMYLALPVLAAMLFVYDYILTMVIKLYRRRIKGQKDDFKLS